MKQMVEQASESAGAAFVVLVGSRGRGLVVGALFGSVSQAALRHARSFVAVVRRARSHQERPDRSRAGTPSPTRRRACAAGIDPPVTR